MRELLNLAAILGVAIEYADLTHLDRDGDYNDDRHVIRLQEGMPYRLKRSVLAHELVHAYYRDVPTMFAVVNAKQERRAEELAARMLITLDAYRAAEQARGGHTDSMAFDLGVDERLVIAYQGMLTRLGDDTYFRSRMGAGQWDHYERNAS